MIRDSLLMDAFLPISFLLQFAKKDLFNARNKPRMHSDCLVTLFTKDGEAENRSMKNILASADF